MTVDQRKLKGEETRYKIIDAAIKIVSSEGISGLSAKKISDLACISKSNVFHHFGNVEGIMDEILNGLVEAFTGSDIREVDSLEELFMMLGRMTFELSEEELDHYKVLFAFYGDVMFNEKFKEQLRAIRKGFVTYFVNIVKKIENKEIPTDLAEIIAIDLDGMGMHYLIELDSDKYMRLWSIKSRIYIDEIRQL